MAKTGIKIEKKSIIQQVNMQTVIKTPSGQDGGAAIWGGIGGDIANQSDLVTLFSGKQNALISGTNIKTINGISILGSGNITISSGLGDMTKSVYDTTDNGIVDNSERLGGQIPSYYATASHTHTTADITNLSSYTGFDSRYYIETEIDSFLSSKENTANKGVSNGYASLDATAKVPLSQIPSSVIGALNYQGSWNASTNSPTLSDGAGSKGLYYVVTTAGSQNLGSGSIAYDAGDWVVHNGTIWERLNDGDVTSVNGQSGVVTLTKTDVGLGNVDNTSDINKPVSTQQQTALDTKQPDIQFKNDGTNIGTSGGVTTIDFIGDGVNATESGGIVTVSIGGGGGGSTRSVNVISSNTTAGNNSNTDYIYLVSGTTNVTLPTAIGNTNKYTIKNVGNNTVTINTTLSQNIDGGITAQLLLKYSSIDVISDGANWNII